jgi:hypothetical protein
VRLTSAEQVRSMVVELWQFSKLAGSKNQLEQRISPKVDIMTRKPCYHMSHDMFQEPIILSGLNAIGTFRKSIH